MSSVCVAVAAVIMSATLEKSPLEEYGDALVGRWVGDITLVADWPGIGKKGEKMVGYESVQWIMDGHALESDFRVGDGAGKVITVWDPVAKVLRAFGTSAGTGSWTSTIRKDGDAWVDESAGWLEDGTKTKGTSRMVLSADGDTRTQTGSGYDGDAEHLPLHDVFRRLNGKPDQRTPVHELGEFLVGRWRGDLKLVTDWPDLGKKGASVIGFVDFEWVADGQAIRCVFHGGNGISQSLIYWDAKTKTTRQVFVFSSGMTRHEVITKEGDKWRFVVQGSMSDGTEFEFDSYLEPQDGGGTAINTGTIRMAGRDAGSFRDVYTRVSAPQR